MNLKKLSIALIGVALAAVLIAQTSQSSSNSTSKNGNAQSSASSSSSGYSSSSGSKNGFASSGGSRNASGNGSGNGSGSGQNSMANVTHAIMYTVETNIRRTDSANQQLQDNHNKYLAELKAKGKVVLYGPWRDMPGAMTIVSAENDGEATEIARNDPAVKAGALKFEVRAWLAK